jgi:DNA topoisomerase-1
MPHTKTVLMIAEKPTAARAIAKALAEKELEEKQTQDGVKWYEFVRGAKKHIVVAAVGHLFTLKQKARGGGYPVFDVDWVPTYSASKFGEFSKKYYDAISAIAKSGSEYIVCCDYDTEGSVIGYNILRFLCGKEDAKRMKFSTMTKEELLESYEKAMPHLDTGPVEAGLARHYLDHLWGVSLSRALMAAIKTSGRRFRILSTGRVQGPTLHMLAKHEKKIKAFKPKPFWQIEAAVSAGKEQLKAEYEKDKIWDKAEADKTLQKSKVKTAAIKDIKTKLLTQKAPKPYNTTSALADIYRYFGYSPAQAMNILEALYQAGLISYPRTSSEKLPADIGYKKIISGIAKQKGYAKECQSLLEKGNLKPEEGSKADPAHPAIYPTGELPKKMGDHQRRVYDLMVRRFLATFGEPAKRQSQRVSLDLGGNMFFISGVKTVEAGWTALYGRYAAREETILPDLKVGGEIPVKSVEQLAKETQPPARYSQGSVLKEMENRGLGTKATRAQILQILYNRGYVVGKSIEVTDLGNKLADILEKNVGDIVSEKLTRHFEQETEAVEQGKLKKEAVIEEAKQTLTKICDIFRKKEKKIGEALTAAIIESQEKQSRLGTCHKCGGLVRMHRLWTTKKRFAGCSNYPKCNFSAPLPAFGFITPLEKVCEQCKTPIVQVQRQMGRPFRMCLDVHCPTKAEWFDKSKLSTQPKKGEAAESKASSKETRSQESRKPKKEKAAKPIKVEVE